MGADLYIKSVDDAVSELHRPAFDSAVAARDNHTQSHNCRGNGCATTKALQKEVEKVSKKLWDENPGYFRDSYNDSDLLWRLDMSWWQNPYINKKTHKLSPGMAKRFRAKVLATPIAEPDNEWWASLTPAQKADWLEYWREKKQKLADFLQRAIELKEHIVCSI